MRNNYKLWRTLSKIMAYTFVSLVFATIALCSALVLAFIITLIVG